MKRSLLISVLILGLAAPTQANPLKKVAHVAAKPLKKLAEKVGTTVLYVGAAVGVIAFCASGGCR